MRCLPIFDYYFVEYFLCIVMSSLSRPVRWCQNGVYVGEGVGCVTLVCLRIQCKNRTSLQLQLLQDSYTTKSEDRESFFSFTFLATMYWNML